MKRKLLRRIACATIVLAGLVAVGLIPMKPAAAEAVILDDAAQADLARIETYLNELKTVQSKFVQLSDSGFARGQLWLSRPGEMRIEYEPPIPVLIVASGVLVMHYDHELRQASFLPVFETPAYFLLRDEIDLSDGLTVTGFKRDPAGIEITLVEADNPDAGQISIVFKDKPLQLTKWRIIDQQGTTIDVALVDPEFGVELENTSTLFSTVDPTLGPSVDQSAD